MARTSKLMEDTGDAEFELTRIRVRPQRISSTLDDWTMRDSQWAAANDDREAAGDEPAIEEPAIDIRRAGRFRRVASRIIGALAITGAFVGIAMVEGKTDARDAIFGWITLGHPDQARHAEEHVRQWVTGIIHH